MANEFIIKKGLISKANSIVSGSLIVTDGVSGSFSGSFEGDGSGLTNVTASFSPTSSYALTASYVETAQTASYVETAQTASYVLNAVSSSYALSASYAVSASYEITHELSSSYAETASFAQSGDGIFSGSFSGSFEGDGSGLTNIPAVSPFPFVGDASITGSLTISGSFNAFRLNTTDVILGEGAGALSTINGPRNVMVGYQAGYTNTSGDDNVAVGYKAGYGLHNNASDANVFIGKLSGAGSTVGAARMSNADNNIGIGAQSLLFLTSGDYNIGIGYFAMRNMGSGAYNLALGTTTLYNTSTGQNNIGIGYYSGFNQTTGNGNITIGSGSLGVAGESNQLRIGNGESVTAISASLETGDIIFASTASAAYFVGDGSQLTNIPMGTSASYAETASFAQSGDGIFSGSFSGSFEGDGSGLTGVISSSYATTASYALTSLSASYAPSSPTISSSYALTASYVNPLTQDVDITGQTDITGNVLVTGSLTVSGSNSIVNLQELQFDTEHIATGHTTGRMYWDDANKTATLDMQGSDVRLQLGQEAHVYATNISGVTINNGDAVRISGATGANLNIELAVSKIKSFKDSTEEDEILGLATEEIPNNQSGYVTTFGSVGDLDTSAFTAGDILYLSNTTSGSYSNTKPSAPYFEARIGVVKVSNNGAGVILSRPQEPTFLTDIAQITSSGVIPNEKTYLCYDDSTDLINFTNEFSGSFSGSFEGDGSGLTGVISSSYSVTSSHATSVAIDSVNIEDLSATGTADATTFLRGDNVWATTPRPTLTDISSTDTFTTADETLNCTSGTFIVNLPTAVGIQGVEYTLVNSGTGSITMKGVSGQTINGSLTISLKRQYTSRTVQSNNVNWVII